MSSINLKHSNHFLTHLSHTSIAVKSHHPFSFASRKAVYLYICKRWRWLLRKESRMRNELITVNASVLQSRGIMVEWFLAQTNGVRTFNAAKHCKYQCSKKMHQIQSPAATRSEKEGVNRNSVVSNTMGFLMSRYAELIKFCFPSVITVKCSKAWRKMMREPCWNQLRCSRKWSKMMRGKKAALLKPL